MNMHVCLRSLLTLLLVLALPLQGGVAAAMMCRAPAQAAMADLAANAQAQQSGAVHDHCADHARADEAGSHVCNACAACCIGGALLSASLPVPADAGFHERPLHARILPPVFITGGTERPPRTVPA